MLASVSDPIARFFSWWGSELTGILTSAPAGPSDSPGAYTVFADAGSYRLLRPNGQRAAGDGDEQESAVPLAELLSTISGLVDARRVQSVRIRIPARACFVRSVSLPVAAARDFDRLLALDLERSTPFKLLDVYSGYVPDQTHLGAGKQSLRQYIIKRSLVDELKSSIEALGLPVTSIQCCDATGRTLPINFLRDRREAKSSTGIKLTIGLIVFALALAVSGAYIDRDRHQEALAQLQAETARLKVDARQVQDMETKSHSLEAAIQNFNRLRHEFVSRTAILEELARVLPDSAWVTDLKIGGSTVDITGFATSASVIAPLLEKSPVFVDATSIAPLTFDPLQDKERFGIRVRLRNAPDESDRTSEEAP